MIKEMGFKKAQKTLRDLYNYNAAQKAHNPEKAIAKLVESKVTKQYKFLTKNDGPDEAAVPAGVEDGSLLDGYLHVYDQARADVKKIFDYIREIDRDASKLKKVLVAFERGVTKKMAEKELSASGLAQLWRRKANFDYAMFTSVIHAREKFEGFDVRNNSRKLMPNASNVIDVLDND